MQERSDFRGSTLSSCADAALPQTPTLSDGMSSTPIGSRQHAVRAKHETNTLLACACSIAPSAFHAAERSAVCWSELMASSVLP